MMLKRPQCAEILIILVWCSVLCRFGAEAKPALSKTQAVRYLSRFGYMPSVDQGREESVSEEAMSTAISTFQALWGIGVTGNMNAETAHIMTLPRCGVKDIFEPKTSDRAKRYVLQGSTWKTKSLTYKIGKYSRKLSKTDVDKEIARAFAVWSEYTDLTFTPKSGKVDIEVRFEIGDHGDGHPFDGRSGVILAHGFFPNSGGHLHFDDDEEWTVNSHRGHNLFEIAVHEIGHSLGLRHSQSEFAVMNPTETPYNPNFKLGDDDIEGIQAIYGHKTNVVPQICEDSQIDTMFTSAEGDVFAFKGRHYWKLTKRGIANGYPKVIAKTWKALRENIDLAFTNEHGETYFIKDTKYWRYVRTQMKDGYPKEISEGIIELPAADMTTLKEAIAASRRTSSVAMRIYCAFNKMTNTNTI